MTETEDNIESTESTSTESAERVERVERAQTTTPDSLTLTELKARRGWLFSVIYLLLILGLILFLSFVQIVPKNRDVLVGILGVLTGSISSMIAVASGRDPAEIEELKSELSAQQADRAALIARLRDAQISLQLKSDQVTQLQTLMIAELAQLRATQLTESDVQLNAKVSEWLPDQDT